MELGTSQWVKIKAKGNREYGAEEVVEPQSGNVLGELRTLHNKELHDLCSSPNIISVIRSIKLR